MKSYRRACPILHLVFILFQVVSIGCLLCWIIYSFQFLLKRIEKIEPTLNRIENSNFVFSKRMKMHSGNFSDEIIKTKNIIWALISLFFLLAAVHFVRASLFLKTIYPCCSCSKRATQEVIESLEENSPNILVEGQPVKDSSATVENTSLTIDMEIWRHPVNICDFEYLFSFMQYIVHFW